MSCTVQIIKISPDGMEVVLKQYTLQVKEDMDLENDEALNQSISENLESHKGHKIVCRTVEDGVEQTPFKEFDEVGKEVVKEAKVV